MNHHSYRLKARDFKIAFLTIASLTLCLMLGVYSCWRECYAPNADGINYLNIGSAFFRGNWSETLNSTWGPLFGIVEYAWLKVMPYGASHPREVLKVLNLTILMLSSWLLFRLGRVVNNLPLAFLFSSLVVCTSVIGVFRETPDLMLTAVVIASALVYLSADEITAPVTMGCLCATGYYLKQSYLPIALLFLLSLSWTRRWKVGLVGVGLFIILISPWILGLSSRQGRFTLGGNGSLNYYLDIEKHGIDNFAAIREALQPSYFSPLDQTLITFRSTHPTAQFPLYYDEADSIRGLQVNWNLGKEIATALENYLITLNLFRHKGPFTLFAVLVSLLFMGRKPSPSSKWIPLLLISIAPFVLYPLVHVEYRYLAPYLLLGSISFWALLTEHSEQTARLRTHICVLAVLSGVLWDTVVGAKSAPAFSCCSDPYASFERRLNAAGVPDGSRLALLGMPKPEHFYVWVNPGGYRVEAILTSPSQFLGSRRPVLVKALLDDQVVAVVAPSSLVPRAEQGWTDAGIGYRVKRIKDFQPSVAGS